MDVRVRTPGRIAAARDDRDEHDEHDARDDVNHGDGAS
jgi:hypothetical protein